MTHQDCHRSLNIVTPRNTTSSSVDTNIKERKEAKRGKKKIKVGSMVTAKVWVPHSEYRRCVTG